MRDRVSTTLALALLLATAVAAAAQEAGEPELRGTVVSAESGEVVAGAWIALEGEQWGTFSWNDGHFFLPEIPGRTMTYEVQALGYEPALLTLDPADSDLRVELRPDPEMQEGLAFFFAQVERRRHRGGDLRVFDREALSYTADFSLGDFLQRHGLRRVSQICLNERPEAFGILEREGHQFYMVETFGTLVRIYTQDFVERAAKERLELQREPRICSGPVG